MSGEGESGGGQGAPELLCMRDCALSPADHAALFARVAASRGAAQPLSAFAGGAHPHTILSACSGTLLRLLSTRAVLPLRAACREARSAVARHPFADAATAVRGSLPAWRACFPCATAASCAGRRAPLAPQELACLRGLRELHLLGAAAEALAAARAALPGTRVLGALAASRAWRARHGHGAEGYGQLCGLAALDCGAVLVSCGRGLAGRLLWGAGAGEALGELAGGASPGAGGAAALPGGRVVVLEEAYAPPCGAAVLDARAPAAAAAAPVCRLAAAARSSPGLTLCVAALPGGRCATGSADGCVRVWCAASGRQLSTLRGHSHHVLALAALGGDALASGSEDGRVRLWNTRAAVCTDALLQDSGVSALAALECGGLACGGDSCSSVWLWVPPAGGAGREGGLCRASLHGHTSGVTCLAALAGGLLASGSRDATVRVWSVAARACVAVFDEGQASVRCLAALPDGDGAGQWRIAVGSRGDSRGATLSVWVLSAV